MKLLPLTALTSHDNAHLHITKQVEMQQELSCKEGKENF